MKYSDKMLPYPSTLKDFGAFWPSVDKNGLLGFGIGPGHLHLRVNGIQIPFKRLTAQLPPQFNTLTDIAIASGPQVRSQGKILLLKLKKKIKKQKGFLLK